MTTDALEISGISKRFGPVQVLRDVGLSLKRGQWGGIVGPTGAGKSTLLKIIAGIDHADEGRIFLDGSPIEYIPQQFRKVFLVWQDLVLFPHLTAAQNIAFGVTSNQFDLRELAGKFHLDESQLQRAVDRLSGGERQRVALARSIAPGPNILLLDEPFGHQDIGTRDAILAQLLEIKRNDQLTALIVSHNQNEVFAIADWVLVLDRGKALGIGRPIDLLNTPPNADVARLIGDNNLFEGTFDAKTKLCQVTVGAQTIAFTPQPKQWARAPAAQAQGLIAMLPSRKVVLERAAKDNQDEFLLSGLKEIWSMPTSASFTLRLSDPTGSPIKAACSFESYDRIKSRGAITEAFFAAADLWLMPK